MDITLDSGAVIRWLGPGWDDVGVSTLGDDAGGASTLGDDAGGAGSVDGTLERCDELKMARRLSMARSWAWQLS